MGRRIQIVIPDNQVEKFDNDVKESGLNISQYILSKIFPEETSFDEIWKEFLGKLNSFPAGIDFDVAIIMGQDRWFELSKSEKLSIARLFNKKVTSGEYGNIKLVGRSSSNVSRYKKFT